MLTGADLPIGQPAKALIYETGLSNLLHAYVELVKPKMVFLLSYVALASGVMHRPAGAREWVAVVVATLGVAIASMGANAITAYLDGDMDALMERTRHRPVPSGVIAPDAALQAGIWFVVVATAVTAGAGLVAGTVWPVFWLLFGVADDVLIYSAWLKRRSPLNIIAGAPSGGAPAAVAASAITGGFLDLPTLLFAALVVLWTPVHIWSLALRYRDDYRKARVPMLPVVVSVTGSTRCIASTSLLLGAFSLALGHVMGMNPVVNMILAPFHVAVLALSVYVNIRPTEQNAWRLFKFTSPYLAIVATALALGSVL